MFKRTKKEKVGEEELHPVAEEPNRQSVCVFGLDGSEYNIEWQKTVGDVKHRISERTGVHVDLMDMFPNSESDLVDDAESAVHTTEVQSPRPLENDHTLSRSASLTVIYKSPVVYEVTNGPPLNCRTEPSKTGEIVKAFQPGEKLNVVGPAKEGGLYGDDYNMWFPILVELEEEDDTADRNGGGAGAANAGEPAVRVSAFRKLIRRRRRTAPTVQESANNSAGEGSGTNTRKTTVVKAWCGGGTTEDPYLVRSTIAIAERS